ncbi:TIGR03364 family FAD-dependent oxidoreductase [Williamsia sp. 1135]|uniref:TIGR03364 family FAD-dependent oxidoreductase n=1 Tax=Williamsia sp. 1135 TaxID=1889262 RepID=UPI000A1004C4|nr:TIGR03364 family FAD-dependent oxidoreductase [Williamsia sp. 1135]ORM30614.1 oxidoreductase [Williamsia sp. 1135]
MTSTHNRHDLVIVGAGIVGLAHAAEALSRGASVAVVERDEYAVGASIRNFGHVCTTAQDGRGLELALVARERWLELGRKAEFGVEECGTVVLARTEDEVAVLAEFIDTRGAEQARWLDRADRSAVIGGAEVLEAAYLPLDLRVDPERAVGSLATWLAAEGVEFHWGSQVTSIDTDENGVAVRTPNGSVHARTAVHAVGHDVDRLYPQIAADWQVQRCRLQMLEVEAPHGLRIEPALLTGLSMLRYAGFAAMPSAAAVRSRFEIESPELLDVEMNLMLTQRPSGALVLGDTHHNARTHTPFDDERNAELLLREGARLFGAPLRVARRWRGVYATSPLTDFLVARPAPSVRVVSVTSGIGMTTALGLAPTVLNDLL